MKISSVVILLHLVILICSFHDKDDKAIIYGDVQRPPSSFITVGIVDHHHHVLRFWEEAVREGIKNS
jgi:hypothetical protein